MKTPSKQTNKDTEERLLKGREGEGYKEEEGKERA